VRLLCVREQPAMTISANNAASERMDFTGSFD
jgi:hypothetical protein